MKGPVPDTAQPFSFAFWRVKDGRDPGTKEEHIKWPVLRIIV